MQPNIIERVWRQDKMVNVDVLNGFTFTDEEEAHRFIISGKNVNTPVNISGTITANFKNADGVLVPLTGTIEDGKAVVVLSQECYAVEGPFSLMIFADTVCIYAAIANVINSSGEVIAYPTATIPSIQELIEEAQDVIASIPQDYSALNQSVQDLKSAITQPTRNLVAGVIREASINADNASGIITANASFDMYYAPVESGKTYYVNTNDSSGLVYGYYSSIPATGSTATAVGGHYRFIDGTNKYFTSQATGYVAFRTAANFAYAQIEEGSVFSGYIAPLSAVDAVIREEAYEEAVFTTTADRILKTDGIEATASGWTRSNAIDVAGTAYVLISGTFNLLTSSSGHTHVLFKSWEDVSATDTSKTYLVKQINLTPTAMAYLNNYMVAVPVGAKYMYICSSTANFGTVSVKKYYDPSSKTKQINISTAQQLYDFLKNPVRNAEVTIEPGSYELYTNLFATDIGNDTDFPITSYMQDVTIHGNNATISFTVPDNVVSAKASVVNTYSILNFIGSCHVYDLTLNAYNLRYAMHIESSTYESAWYSKYVFENCKFIYADHAGAVSLNRNAVGIGGSKGQHYVFKNCHIEDSTHVYTFYIHTRTYNMSELLIDNCVFSNKSNGYGLLLSQYTGNGKPVDVNIVNSVIGKIYMTTQSGGVTNNQYRIVAVNSYIPDIIVDENTTLLFNPKRANAITGDIDTTHN